MVGRGRNNTSNNHCAINRSILVQWHGANQSFVSGSLLGTFKANWFVALVKAILSFLSGGVDVAHQGPGREMIWLFDYRCTPTMLVDRVDLATRLSLSSQRLPASRLLLPRSGLERSDFVLWHFDRAIRS